MIRTAIQYLVDATVALLLVTALGYVYHRDQATATPAPTTELVEVASEAPPPPPPPPLKIAVTYCPADRAEYDDVGKLLDKLGQGYEYTKIHMNDLAEPTKLAQFDVVFATCGTFPRAWLDRSPMGPGTRPGTERHGMNRRMFEQAKEALRGFVGSGKTLYVSDQLQPLLMYAFPEYEPSSGEVHEGTRQTLVADVVDAGLSEQLGQTLELKFDLPDWYPARFDARGMTTYLEGRYETMAGGLERAPLLVKIPHEQGTIFFTSFHNEKQNSEKELQLLKYLVFATVTAREAAAVNQQMVKGGFSPRKQSLLSASGRSMSASQVFRNLNRGRLRFVLGFENRGARLKLSVVGPDGKTIEKEGSSTLMIEIDDAAPGDWRYTVTAITVPYENFPFTVTIGDK